MTDLFDVSIHGTPSYGDEGFWNTGDPPGLPPLAVQLRRNEALSREVEYAAEKHARSTHPSTSHESAAFMEAKIGRKMAEALEALRRHPNHTAAELEAAENVRGGTIRKRLNDLREHSLAATTPKRRCRVTGRPAHPWIAT